MSASTVPTIYRLNIERFRGIKALSWYPSRGVNVILGGGDVGKTTVLESIALLLSPTHATTITDTDYTLRDEGSGFVIEAIMALPSVSSVHDQRRPSWPWQWNGTDAVVPGIDGEPSLVGDPVYRLRVRGTEDLELFYEIIQPDGSVDNLSVGLRRRIGLVRLGGDDRNDRDLRLVHGSALDRLLSDKGLRSRLTNKLSKGEVTEDLTDDAKELLKELDHAFRERRLPDGLDLAVIGSQGLTITALIGLTAKRENVALPLASWGAGTRRLAALAIAEQNQGECPVTLVDEVERGLEPYRQRVLMEKLQAGQSQVFITTHSPAAIAAASSAGLWYIDHAGRIGSLAASKIARHRKSSPETFLARLAVVAEGATEVGFCSALLEKAIGSALEPHGLHITDGGGHETALDLLEALADGGLHFAGFADDENGKHPMFRWKNVAEHLGSLLFRWSSGCLEENVIQALPDESLEAFIVDPADEKTGMRLRTLQERVGGTSKEFGAIRAAAGGDIRRVIIAAALGKAPADRPTDAKQFRSHATIWFKSEKGGRELANKVFDLHLWPTLKPQLLPFCNAVLAALELPQIVDIDP